MLRNGRLVGEYLTAELPQVDLVSKMIGEELEAPRASWRIGQPAPADAPAPRPPPFAGAAASAASGAIEPFDLDDPRGRGGRPRRAARLRAHRGRPAVLRRRPRRPRPARGRRHAGAAARTPRAAMAQRDRLLLGEPPDRGHHRRPHRPREHHPRAAGRAGAGSVRSRAGAQDELVDQYIKALRIRPANPEALVGNLSGGNQQKVLLARWLITEPEAADPRRADPRHRRRRQGRDPAAGRRPGRRRHGGAVHLRRAGGGAAAQPPDRGAARPADGRGAGQRPTDVDACRHHGRRSRAERAA